MNDKELRLKVLSILYQSAREGKNPPGTMKDPGLEGISIKEYQWTSYYLIENNLCHGKIQSTTGGVNAWAGRITDRGIKIIENLIDKSVEQVQENKISITSKAITYLQKLTELLIIWSNNPDLHEKAWELLTSLIK